ncbi:hypothetical protein [Ruegeria arenilitoris]|uniref:hypothetical protein n=1 Tax=Ruegeria arenilitoris TaxID=1173585 RepID=UPI00147B26D0|nr:hypothetical protein [Ruegeria arenilitoris]
MSQFELLEILRNQYPSTTAAAHNLVQKASELRLARENQVWIDFHGSNKATVAFEDAMWEALLWAARETGETSAERLLKFMANFLAQFALACPRWNSALPEVADYLFDAGGRDKSLLVDAVAQVKGEHLVIRGLGRPALKEHSGLHPKSLG